MQPSKSAKLALLIDADNISANVIDALLTEVAKYGNAKVKRIYGDWSKGLSQWKQVLKKHALSPIQQFAYTKGKNATDIAMVIDAMDLLHSDRFDGFCLVSSDSDFTKLAYRIRENALLVYGFGTENTPKSLYKACDEFIHLEQLMPAVAEPPAQEALAASKTQPTPVNRATAAQLKSNTKLVPLLRKAIKRHANATGWASLANIGTYMNKHDANFDVKLFGYAKLSGLVKAIGLFDTKVKHNDRLVRCKKTTSPASSTCAPKPTVSQTNRRPNGTAAAPQPVAARQLLQQPLSTDSALMRLLQQAINSTAATDGWANLSALMTAAKQQQPDFNCKAYGYNSNLSLLKAMDQFDTQLHQRKWRVRCQLPS